MSLPIHIPEPCHQNWDGMKAQSNGRFCGACEKIVVDFSTWEPDQILDYLKTNSKTCGRFKTDQLIPPTPTINEFSGFKYINQSGLPRISRLAATIFLLFIFASCGNETTTTSNNLNSDTSINQAAKDSNISVILQGEPIMTDDTVVDFKQGEVSVKPPNPPKEPKIKEAIPTDYIVGEIAPPPEPPVVPNDSTLIEIDRSMIMGAPVMKYNERNKIKGKE